MKDEEFVIAFKKIIMDSKLSQYKVIIQSSVSTSENNSHLARIASFSKNLDDNEKKLLLWIIRNLQLDVVYSILGLIDGSVFIMEENTYETFVLKMTNDKDEIEADEPYRINHRLQELFLNVVR